MSIKVTPKARKVLVSLAKQVFMHKGSIKQANYEIGQLFVNENRRILNTGSRTGRLYRIAGRNHQSSAPGEPPATITGRLARSADYLVHGWHTMSLGQRASYADFLEYGTRNIRPRKNVILAINNIAAQSSNAYYQSFRRHNQ
jgi:hypothetical protein